MFSRWLWTTVGYPERADFTLVIEASEVTSGQSVCWAWKGSMSLIRSHETFQNVYVESSTRSGGRRSRRVVGDLLRRSQILCSVRIPNDEKKSPLLKPNSAKSALWE